MTLETSQEILLIGFDDATEALGLLRSKGLEKTMSPAKGRVSGDFNSRIDDLGQRRFEIEMLNELSPQLWLSHAGERCSC